LLKITDFTLAELAPKVGFGSGNYLQTTFTKTFGLTPRAYRLRK
jgi:AraC-like DNA-binding protein